MKYEIQIGMIRLYEDLGLVVTSKPLVSLPSPRLSYLEVIGVQGSLDLTESVDDEILYDMRRGSFEFLIAKPDYFQKKRQIFFEEIHGKRNTLQIKGEDFYYVGRFLVKNLKADKNSSILEIEYYLDPFKYPINRSLNTQDIKNPGLRELSWINLTGSQRRVRLGTDLDLYIKPRIEVKNASSLFVQHQGASYKLYDGMNIIPEIKQKKGMELIFTGRGSFQVSFQEGAI